MEAQLKSIKLCYEFDPEMDRICFVLDRDFQSFQEFQYDSVIKICEEENFLLGVNSPNFEFFLLLHIEAEFPDVTKEEIFQNKDNFSETTLKRLLKDKHGEIYRKSNYNADFFINRFATFKQNIQHYEQDKLKLKTHVGSSLGLVIDKLIN